jgi:S1-C subfamily serine protease
MPWLGICRFDAVTETAAKLIGLDPNAPGIMASDIVPDEPADQAGLKNRDVIIAVNKQRTDRLAGAGLTVQSFIEKLKRVPVGQKVALTVVRPADGKTYEFEVTTAPMPPLPQEAQRGVNTLIGLAVRERVEPLDSFLIKGPTAKVKGLIVIVVARNGPAARAGLEEGDVILAIDGEPTLSVDRFKAIVDAHVSRRPQAGLVVLMQRGDKPQGIRIKVPPPPTTATAPASTSAPAGK